MSEIRVIKGSLCARMNMIAVARTPDRVQVSGMWAIIESLLEACMSVIWKCELSFFYGSLLIVCAHCRDEDNDERESIDQQMDHGDDLMDFDGGPHQPPHDDGEDEAQVDSGRENFDEGENEAQGDSNQEDLDDLDAEQDNVFIFLLFIHSLIIHLGYL